MTTYFATIGIIFAIMLGGIAVERAYRAFAARNPQLGPFRDVGKCGSCSEGSGCNDTPSDIDISQHDHAPRH